ncbi:MAG: hypothetical protein ACRD4Q_16580, partial [Candidatus Acidiferrales bacterium]
MNETKVATVSPLTVSRVFAGMALISIFISLPRAGSCAQPQNPPAHATGVRSSSRSVTIPLTLQKGMALRVALANRLAIGRKGEPVEGRLIQPVYAFDRIIAPAGTKVLGRVTAITTAPRMERLQAMVRGDFTPLRSAQVEFDTLVLKDGRHIPIQTRASPGIAHMVHLEVAGQHQGKRENIVFRTVGNAKRQMEREKKQVIADIRRPGRMHRVKEWLVSELPYHR